MANLHSPVKKFPVSVNRALVFWVAVVIVGVGLFLRQAGERTTSTCQTAGELEKRGCFIQAIRTSLQREGVARAFETLHTFYKADSSFSEVCHSLTHEIGAFAYGQFARGWPLPVSRNFATCSYGFYHGFMERLGSEPNAAEQAKQFCAMVDEKMKRITPDATLQCFHGIGHGFVNSHDPATWGDEMKLITPALALCERVATTELEKSRCATGVFNGIATFYNEGLYSLVVNAKDPLAICRKQKKEYQDACYISLNITLLQLTNGDLLAAAKFLEPISDNTMAGHAMINLAAPVGTKNIGSNDHKAAISACRLVQGRLGLPCIQGYAFGMLEHGEPGKEYEKPLAFCGSAKLTAHEEEACFSYLIGYLPQWYPPQKVYEICRILPANYQARCLENT